MATHTGADGAIKIGTYTVAEVRSFSLDNVADTLEDTVMGDTNKTFKVTKSEWGGQITCFWDPSDTNGQEAMTVGATVTLELYPDGTDSGDTYYTGAAIITSINRSAAHDGMVEATFSFKSGGTLTQSTV